MTTIHQLDPQLRARFLGSPYPASEVNQQVFHKWYRNGGDRKRVLNCATTPSRAFDLVNFGMPPNWNYDKCLKSYLDLIEPGLENWDYEPIIQPQPQLPYFKTPPGFAASLAKSPWTQYPSQSAGPALNARLLRHHHSLWQELRPKTLRGICTTLVLVSPQISISLTPLIRIDKFFHYFAALSRAGGPCQMMPAAYLYPDSRLQGLENTPAAMFADILPHVGGDAYPVMECTPNPWGELARYHIRNYYGYPFSPTLNPGKDVRLTNTLYGGITLPNGQTTQARTSESQVFATLNPELGKDLLLDDQAFRDKYALIRGTVTHDGIPFQLPPEMEAAVFAINVTAWELEMKTPGDLSDYTLRTQHASIRSYHYYQQIEPYYSQFMRLLHGLAREPHFETYLLSNHLSNGWLGGNLCLPNRHTDAEKEHGARFVRNRYRQQLDWLMGVMNLWNLVSFRSQQNLQDKLPFEGVAFHQIAQWLACSSYLFNRPVRPASPWPGLHPGWSKIDRGLKVPPAPQPTAEWFI